MQIKCAPHASVECFVHLKINVTCERYCCLLIRPKWFKLNQALCLIDHCKTLKVEGQKVYYKGGTFLHLAPRLLNWNILPNNVCGSDTLSQFKSRLKTSL